MLRAKTTTARFKSSAKELHDFIGNVENLPKWATIFCQDLRKEDGDFIVTTPGGDMFFKISNDDVTGVADMWGGPSKDMMMRWPVRVVDDGLGGSVLMFTNIQTEDQPDEVFDGLCKALEDEFDNIRKYVEN